MKEFFAIKMNNIISMNGKRFTAVFKLAKRQQLVISKHFFTAKIFKVSSLKTFYLNTTRTVPIRSKCIFKSHEIFNYNSRFLSSIPYGKGKKKVVEVPSKNKEIANKIFIRHFEDTAKDGAVSEDQWIEKAAEFTEKKIGLTLEEQKQLLKQKPQQPPNARILKVAIIGAPNAGKSTLANQILGWRYSAVSSKVHTTRHKSIGVLTEDNTQIIFLDTPGMITPDRKKKHRLEKTLLTDPHSTLYDADIIMVVVDVSEVWHRHQLGIEILKVLHLHKNKQTILVLNKADLYRRQRDLMHTSRILTEGVVGGRTDWYQVLRGKQKKKIDLDSLFDRVDSQYGRVPITQSSGHDTTVNNCEISANEDSLENISDYSKTFTAISESDNDVNCSDEIERHENIDSDKRWLGENCGLNDNENEGERPNLMDHQEWEHYYYQKIRKIGHEIEGKSGYDGFERVFHISALDNIGVDNIKDYLFEMAKPGNWQYNESVVTDLNPIEIAKMCVWEKLLDHLPKEIPYTMEIKLALWEVDDDGLLRAVFELFCSKKRYMFNVLGDGQLISKIAEEAKQELMNTFRREMSLHLVVKLATPKKK